LDMESIEFAAFPRTAFGRHSFRKFSSGVDQAEDLSMLVDRYASRQQTSVSLQTLMRTGRGELLHKTANTTTTANSDTNTDTSNNDKAATQQVLIQVASFLYRELPARLAHRIQDLDHVPYMSNMPSVRNVRDTYVSSFRELVSQPIPDGPNSEEQFAKLVEGIYDRHAGVLVSMARGAFELRAALRKGEITLNKRGGTKMTEFAEMEELHDFLDRFYTSRIGIRVLIGQYLALRRSRTDTDPDYVGIIGTCTNPYEIVTRAIDDATFMCTRKYGDAPDVRISGNAELTFPYVPTHLHYILLELLKNSMRATMDFHGPDGADVDDLPPIEVVISNGKEHEDVVIKVADEGGGIPRSNMKKIWSYLFTTADPAIQEGMIVLNENVDHGIDSPLAGLGYGLPISRSYAQYFGGDLSIMSMEGHGTDAFVHLVRLGNTREPLPI